MKNSSNQGDEIILTNQHLFQLKKKKNTEIYGGKKQELKSQDFRWPGPQICWCDEEAESMGWHQTVRQQERVQGREGEFLASSVSIRTNKAQRSKPFRWQNLLQLLILREFLEVHYTWTPQLVNLPEVDCLHFPFFHETKEVHIPTSFQEGLGQWQRLLFYPFLFPFTV